MKAFENKKKYLLIAEKDDFWYPLIKYGKYMSLNNDRPTEIEFLDYYSSGYEDQYIIDSFDDIEDMHDKMCEYYYFRGYEDGKLENPLTQSYGKHKILTNKKGARRIRIVENLLENLYLTRNDLLEKWKNL